MSDIGQQRASLVARLRLGDRNIWALGYIASAATVGLFTFLYVAAEQPAYFWDYGNYFNMFNKFVGLLRAPGRGWHDSFWWGIHHDDYNASSLTLLMPFGYVFGPSRTTYILAIVMLYLTPAALLMAKVATHAAGLPQIGREATRERRFAALFALLSWPLWIAALRGMPDVIGLIPLMLATLILMKTRYLRDASALEAAASGFALWASFLFRRWYAYSCLSLIVLAFFFCAADVFIARRQTTWFTFWDLLEKYAVLAIALVAPLLIFQGPLTYHILATNYSDIYKMYQHPLYAEIAFVYGIFGPFVGLTAAAGFAYAIVCRNTNVIFCSCAGFLTFAIFVRTQSPGEQHIIPFYAFLFPALMWAIVGLNRLLRYSRRQVLCLSTVSVLMSASFCFVFWPEANARLQTAKFLFPTYTVFPLQIANYDAYQKMMQALSELAGTSKKIVVLASTEDLSGTTIEAIDRPLSAHLEPTSEVDARDGVRWPALAADLAVVADPPAAESPDFQRVITIPAAMILARRGYGSAFERVSGPFILAHGMKALIYRRTRAMSAADAESLMKEFRRFYPSWTLQDAMKF